jgi:hypothetical protein
MVHLRFWFVVCDQAVELVINSQLLGWVVVHILQAFAAYIGDLLVQLVLPMQLRRLVRLVLYFAWNWCLCPACS